MTLKKILVSIFVITSILASAVGYEVYTRFPGSNEVSLVEAVGGQPVNYLVLGSDSRGEEKARSDTIVIFRVDPKNDISYLISIPRDLRVDIPDKGLSKINAATAIGGPELMIETIKDFTDLDINHYALLNFKGFITIIDSLGGIEVDVEEAIDSKESGYEMKIKAGRQILDGTQALNYVRFRHDAQGDLGRIKRQQQFFKALASELLSFRTIPKIPSLVNIFADNTETDMGSSQMIKLAWALRDLDKDRLVTVTFPGTPVRIGGVSYLNPEDEKIEMLLNGIKAGREIDQEKMDIRIKVLNGDGDFGSALKLKETLKGKGFNVVAAGDAIRRNEGAIIVYCRPGDEDKARKVASALKNAKVEISSSVFTSSFIDIIVVTGTVEGQ